MSLRSHTALLAALLLAACSKPAQPKPAGAPAAAFPAGLFLAADPGGAKPIAKIKEEAKVGDAVTLRGRVGGCDLPFEPEGFAQIKIIDVDSTITCPPGEGCNTPWDYCCAPNEDKIRDTAVVAVNGPKGVLALPLRGAGVEHKLKEMSLVTVTGKVIENAKGNLTVDATGIYVGPVDLDGKIAGTKVKGMK